MKLELCYMDDRARFHVEEYIGKSAKRERISSCLWIKVALK